MARSILSTVRIRTAGQPALATHRTLGPGPLLPRPPESPRSGLVDALGAGATLDELAVRLQRSHTSLAADLLKLELSGRVLCESGFLWKASQR